MTIAPHSEWACKFPKLKAYSYAMPLSNIDSQNPSMPKGSNTETFSDFSQTHHMGPLPKKSTIAQTWRTFWKPVHGSVHSWERFLSNRGEHSKFAKGNLLHSKILHSDFIEKVAKDVLLILLQPPLYCTQSSFLCWQFVSSYLSQFLLTLTVFPVNWPGQWLHSSLNPGLSY